ncbi:MAG TPA: hypothetical protein VEZ14_08565 [Dehalococcoidia bacterium]|nr:hypothetical protein [Dehalococcoidia bacterium]
MAQTPGANPNGPTFLDRVAQRLGIETPKLQDAVKAAAIDEIDAAVARGTLTQPQADQIKQQIAAAPAEAILGGPFGAPQPPGPCGGSPLPPGVAPDKLASYLGISPPQLMAELQPAGATLATVAAAHGRTRDDLKTFIMAQAKAALDQAVAAGHVVPQQETLMLTQLVAHLDTLIDARGIARPLFGGSPSPFPPGVNPVDLAAFLGIGPDQLPGELQTPGATLAAIAAKHGKAREQLASFILDHATIALNAAVSNGGLSQPQASATIAMLHQHIGQLIDTPFGMCAG